MRSNNEVVVDIIGIDSIGREFAAGVWN